MFQDTRLSQTPYHALTTIERAIYNERKELLAFIAKRFREEVSKYDHFLRLPTPNLGSFFFISRKTDFIFVVDR